VFLRFFQEAAPGQVHPVHVVDLLHHDEDHITRLDRILKLGHMVRADLADVQQAFLARKDLDERAEAQHSRDFPVKHLSGLRVTRQIANDLQGFPG
jgi:hypothetical protein